MDEETRNNYLKAGKIAADVLMFGKSLIKKGARPLDICDQIENKIKELGGSLAFPTQISLNETAAHYCPEEDEDIKLTDEIACLDVGVHINGCIGDNACSVDLSGEHRELIKASEEALKAALEIAHSGTTLAKIGKSIEDAITNLGFQPVRNLSGHGLGIYNIHQAPTIPNFDTGEETVLEDGMAIAIEPFATTGVGMIAEKGDASVFALTGKKPVRVGFVRNIQKEIECYQNLPFTSRWLTRKFSEAQVGYALNQFSMLGILQKYPPLVEKSKGLVSQAEKSLIVGNPSLITTDY